MWQNRWKMVADGDNDSDNWRKNSFTNWSEKGYNSRGLRYESTPPLPRRNSKYLTAATTRDDPPPYYVYNYDSRPVWQNATNPNKHMPTMFTLPYRRRSLPGSISEYSYGDGYHRNRSHIKWLIVPLIVILLVTIITGVTLAIYFGTRSTNKQQSTTTTAVPPVVETVVVSGSLQMNELVFVDDYNDPTSDAYQILATEVCEQSDIVTAVKLWLPTCSWFETLYAIASNLADQAFEGCNITGFREGPVIAEFAVTITVTITGDTDSGPVDTNALAEKIKTEFTEALSSGIDNGQLFEDKGINTEDITVEARITTTDTDVDSSNMDGSGEEDAEEDSFIPA